MKYPTRKRKWKTNELQGFLYKRVCVFCLQIASLPPILKLQLKHCYFEKSNLIIPIQIGLNSFIVSV